MSNLLEETIHELKQHKKTPKDVKWVGNINARTDWDNFKEIANEDYSSGFGGQEVVHDLLIVGNNWWLERHEYDGSEWWEYKEIPLAPSKQTKLKTVIFGS